MFKTDDKRRNDSELIKQALIRAAERGLHVEAVMDIAKKDDLTTKFNLDTGDELAEAGVIIRYDDVRQRMHAKTMVIDGRITYIGSHNYTHSALKYNDEITARIVSEGTAGETIEFIKSLN
jgi:phosphatidylserine/phosphatidylglycerophosphate/cardiolipin synthase-like enzyme